MADPGFPVGGRGPRRGGPWTPEAGTFQKILYVKMKESGPVGGARAGRAPLDPPMDQFTTLIQAETFLIPLWFTPLINLSVFALYVVLFKLLLQNYVYIYCSLFDGDGGFIVISKKQCNNRFVWSWNEQSFYYCCLQENWERETHSVENRT